MRKPISLKAFNCPASRGKKACFPTESLLGGERPDMELANEPGDRKRKRSIQVVSVIFMGLLLFLTFFSNTLQSVTLPKVRTESLVTGSLLFTIEGSSMLQPFNEARL